MPSCEQILIPSGALHDNRNDERYVLTARRQPRYATLPCMICGDLAYSRLCLCFTRRLPLVPGRMPATFHPEYILRNENSGALMPCHCLLCNLHLHSSTREREHVEETEPGEDGRSHRFSQDEKMNYVRALEEEIKN